MIILDFCNLILESPRRNTHFSSFDSATYMEGCRIRSRIAPTSKMERFGIIVNDWKALTIMTKRSILDTAAALNPPLGCLHITATIIFNFSGKII